MSKQQKISSGYSNAQSELVQSSFDENKGGGNPYLQFISTATGNEENPYKQFLPKEEDLPPLISPYQERKKQQYQNAVKEATLSNIVKASKKPYGILSPQETNPLGVSDESTIRNPRNDAMDKIMQIITSPAEGTVTGLGEGLNTLVESGKQFRQGNIIAGGLGELAGLAQTGISAATPFVPTIQAFTAGQRALQEIGGGDISNAVMSPVETITQPKTFTGQNAAKLADLLYNIALFRGVDKGLEKFKGSDYENKNQTTSPVSPIEGKPALKQTEGQTETRTPQRGSEGIQQEKTAQPDKGLEERFKPNLEKSGVDADRIKEFQDAEKKQELLKYLEPHKSEFEKLYGNLNKLSNTELENLMPKKSAEDHLIETPLHNLPNDIKEKIQSEASSMFGELKGASKISEQSHFISENVGKGWETTRRTKSFTIYDFPEWFSQLGRGKDDVMNALNKILEDEGKDKGKLVESLKAQILAHLSQGRELKSPSVITSGVRERPQTIGEIPPDAEIVDFLNQFANKSVSAKELNEAYQKYLEKQTSFEFGANIPKEKIISTAVNQNGKILTGKDKFESHNNIGEQNGIGKPAENTRGFLVEDENGNQRFVDRKEGAKIAQESGQIEKPVEELHSEDLQKAGFEEVRPVTSNYNEVSEKAPNVAGISQRVREARSDLTKVPPTQRGIGWNAQEALNRGDYLRRQGITANDVINRFNQTGALSDDDIAVVRSEVHELQRAANRAGDDYGINSTEYKDALQKANELENKVKPLQTQSSRIFSAQQGYEQLDADSKTGTIRYFETVNKKPPTVEQVSKINELTNSNKILSDKINELEAKTQQLLREHLEQTKSTREKTAKGSIRLSSKELADKIRKNAKIHKPGAFYSATPASMAWDAGVEVVAQTIEQGGKLIDAVQKGVEKLKETDWYKGLSKDKQSEAEKSFREWHDNQSAIKIDLNSLRDSFADKKDNKFTTAETNAIWQYAKDNYIDEGKGTYEDMIHNVSQDLGLRPDQVRDAIAQPKQIRNITDGIYRIQNRRRVALQQTKAWIESANKPGWQRFIASLPNRFFGWYVFGHGTVFGITHAGMELFRPTAWKNYFPALIRQFKYAYGDPALYEQAMTDLQNRPNYILAKRAGLANDPVRIYDDYMLTDKYFSKIGLTGERGFNSWKIYRQDMFDNVWDHLSDALKSDPNVAKELAAQINHSTGTANVIFPKSFNVGLFAPRLEASRWIRLFVEPAKALKTFTNWKNASLSDKFAAKLISKRAGEMLATYSMMLAANEGINQLTGSKQHVNFTDPTKSDWMRFVGGGKVIDVSGGMLSTTTFVARLLEAAIESTKAAKRQSRGGGRSSLMMETAGKYVRGKLSPFAGTAFSIASHTDYAGNVLPPFKDKPAKGRKHLSWAEYLLTQQMPIPLSEGIKDVYDTMKSKGMTEPQIETILNGIFISAVAGGTGARVREEYKKEYKK